ncbi:IS3 family transposase [Dactylosporangium siamense]
MTALIEQIHQENDGVYGARKVWHEVPEADSTSRRNTGVLE